MTGIASSKFWLKCLKRECYLPRRQSPFNNSSTYHGSQSWTGWTPVPVQVFHDYPFEITPVTDNAPFFLLHVQATHYFAHAVSYQRSGQHRLGLDDNLGLVVLGPCSSSLSCSFWFPRLTVALHKTAHKPPITPLLYFVALGLGFIVVEIALIQRFVLFPASYLRNDCRCILLFSRVGAGSFASKYWLKETREFEQCSRNRRVGDALRLSIAHRVRGARCLPSSKKLRSVRCSCTARFSDGDAISRRLREIAGQTEHFQIVHHDGEQYDRVGMGDECGIECAGLSAGYRTVYISVLVRHWDVLQNLSRCCCPDTFVAETWHEEVSIQEPTTEIVSAPSLRLFFTIRSVIAFHWRLLCEVPSSISSVASRFIPTILLASGSLGMTPYKRNCRKQTHYRRFALQG